MASILPKDTDIKYPNFILVSASAGSGKTHALTLRLLQLLLSDYVPNNSISNILAVTFTKNAATEMKGRLLDYLKKAHFGDGEILSYLNDIVLSDKDNIQRKSRKIIEDILDNYSDLHIQTIDSFLTRIFKSSALEYGFTPQVEIILEPRTLVNEAFDNLVNELNVSTEENNILDKLISQIIEAQRKDSSYMWNPYIKIKEEINKLYDYLMTQLADLALTPDCSNDLNMIRNKTARIIHEITTLIDKSSSEPQKWFAEIVEKMKAGDIDTIVEENYSRSLIKKTSKRSSAMKSSFEYWQEQLTPFQQQLFILSSQYAIIKAQMFYQPYVIMQAMLLRNLEIVKRREGKISISEINKKLAAYLQTDIVPEIYYGLGENIFHYLIDEFQDTSPIQWGNMRPLLENAVAQNGSLFIVGDTKQSIFTFRGADWRIMKQLMERQEFPSVATEIRTLDTNYRSSEEILNFNEEIFHNIIPKQVENGIAKASGLSTYKQNVNPKYKEKGFVNYLLFDIDNEGSKERSKLLEIIKDCKNRGVAYSDIAIITSKNTDVVEVSGWLNEEGIDFISHSSLDVRSRKLTGDILALLKFLDSPIDDLSFANVIIGKIFQRILAISEVKMSTGELHQFVFNYMQSDHHKHPLYSEFRTQFPILWNKYFAELYRLVGYLPMYDLVSAAYKIFHLFELFSEEEATLVKILDVINTFEGNGQNSLSDFILFMESEAEEGQWNVNIPTDLNAVSVMTIHKAKGLGFRVVIALFYDSRRLSNNLFTEENDERIILYRITQSESDRSEKLKNIYLEQRRGEQIDDLNKLYVALTRAEEEMYVLCVKNKYANEPSCFLPQNGYESGCKSIVKNKEDKIKQWAEITHSSTLTLPAPISIRSLKRYERKRGDLIHAVLENIIEIEQDIELQIESIVKTLNKDVYSQIDSSSLIKTITKFIEQISVREWFEKKSGRSVMNEQDFTSKSGQLFRMDRVIIDEESVTVLDFKTGDEKESHDEQINKYKSILEEVFPGKKVQGALAYVDKKEINWI